MFVDNVRDRKREGKTLSAEEDLAKIMDDFPLPNGDGEILLGKKPFNGRSYSKPGLRSDFHASVSW